MECSDARHLIHLDVGDDLRVEEDAQLAEHMSSCSDCRSYHAGMSRAMSALIALRDSPSSGREESGEFRSVWPSLSREIQRRRVTPAKVQKFNLQVVALSVCSLSLAVVTIVQSLSAMRGSAEPQGFMPAQSVSNVVDGHPFRSLGQPGRETTSEPLRPIFVPDTAGGPQSF